MKLLFCRTISNNRKMIGKNADIHWDDLRVVLAVYRSESLSGAARLLGVNQTTVSRRIQGLEAALGGRLFDRADGRHTPTALGAEVVERAERIETEMIALAADATGAKTALSGAVRVTAVGSIIDRVLAPGVDTIARRHPDIHLQLIGSNTNFSFTRRETDLALRMGRPRSGAMLARKLADVGFAVYGAKGGEMNMAGERWIAYDESLELVAEHRWLLRHLGSQGARERIVMRTNSVASLKAAIASGAGQGVLPFLIGDAHPGLERLSGKTPVVERELWLLTHQELATWPRIRAVSQWICERVATVIRTPHIEVDT